MKKVIFLILVLAMCLPLCACTGTGWEPNTNNVNPNEIELTLENYEQYIDIHNVSSYGQWTEVEAGYHGIIGRAAGPIKCTFQCDGVSSNFNYNDVKIKVRFYGTYGTTTLASVSNEADEGSYRSYDVTLEFSTNIAGSASSSEVIESAPTGKAIVEHNRDYEIVAISGTVTPA